MSHQKNHSTIPINNLVAPSLFHLFSALLILTLLAFLPLLSPSVQAANISATESIDFDLDPVLSIASSSSNIFLGTAPGVFAKNSADLTVHTNNPYGYTLTMQVGGSDNQLHHSGGASNTINSLSGTVTEADFISNGSYDNKWGWTIDPLAIFGTSASYSAFPAAANSLTLKTASTSGVDVTKFTVGVKPANNLIAGVYTNSLIFSAATIDTDPATSFAQAFAAAGKTKVTVGSGQYYKMQDMDSGICSAVTIGNTTTQTEPLVDTRNNKIYNVAKLKSNPEGTEGNCWMVENLRLGSAAQTTPLTPADSNVASNFTLPVMSITQPWTSTYTTPMLYPSDDQNTDPTKGALGYYGYYYNFYAATAGTLTNTLANTTSDLCPKGWSLPPNYYDYAPSGSAAVSSGYKKSFSALLYAYGVITNVADSSTYNLNGFATISAPPLQFVLNGRHDSSNSNVINRGINGYYWTSYSQTSDNASNLNFSSSNISPRGSGNKANGFSIRCVAK